MNKIEKCDSKFFAFFQHGYHHNIYNVNAMISVIFLSILLSVESSLYAANFGSQNGADTYVWTKLLEPSQMLRTDLPYSTYMFDKETREFHSLHQATSSVYSFHIDSLSFNVKPVTGIPITFHTQIYNPSNKTIQFWRAGPDNVYQVSVNGGPVSQKATGSSSTEHWGASLIYNGVTREPSLMFGYGLYRVRNALHEVNGSSWVIRRSNSSEEPFKRLALGLFPNHNYSKAYIVDGYGNQSGSQTEKSCTLQNGKGWASDVGVWCWLRDIWEVDLSDWSVRNILPHSSDFPVTGRFGFDYDTNTFFSFGGYVPSPIYGQTGHSEDSLRIFTPGVHNGWTTVIQTGDIPPLSAGFSAHFDSREKRFVMISSQGVWELRRSIETSDEPITVNKIPNYLPTDGLLGWWPFNGDASDESGNGNDGVLNGNIIRTKDRINTQDAAFEWPNINSGYNSNAHILLPNLSSQFGSEITVSMWVLKYPNTVNGDPRLLSIGESGLIFDSNSSSIKAYLGVGLDDHTNPIGENEWVHIAFVSNGNFGESFFYINGILTHQRNISSIDANIFNGNNYNWNIGRKSISAFDGFGGKIDDIGIWNRALTEQEIQSLYTGEVFEQESEELLVSVLVSDSRGHDQILQIGTSYITTDGYDEGVDLALPPPPPGQTLRAWFSRPDWNAPLGPDFSSDIRAVRDLTSQVQSWTLNVRTEQAGRLTLRLAPDGAPSGLPLSVSLNGVNASGMDSVIFSFDAQAALTYSILIEVGDLTAPVVRLEPDLSGPAIWQADQPRRIGWSIDEANRLSRLHLQYRVEPGDWQSLHDGAALEHYDWTPVAADDTTRRVWFRLEAVDAAGNAGSDSTSYPVTVASPRQGIGFQAGWAMVSNPVADAEWSQQGPALRYVWQAGEYRQPQELADAQGYWLGGYRAGADTLRGTVRGSEQVLTLPAGWNLTGSGLLTPVRVDSVSVTHGGHGRSLPLPAAIDSSWVTAPFGFDGQSYGAEDVFVPKRGYWLGVSVWQGVSLSLPVHRQDSPVAKEPAPQTAPSLWITLRDGASAHRLGVSSVRAVPAPPTAPNASRIGLLGPASALGSVYLQAKADPQAESAWPLVIGGEARTIELSWTDQDFAGLTAVLQLTDRRYDLTRANSISLRSDESAQVLTGPVSTSTERSDQGPLRTELMAAYPNPFNPSTVIGFTVGTQDLASLQTRLVVYDLLGRQVAVLVNGTMPAGRHQVTFDASGLASGVYLVRLEAGGEVFTRRMTLVK
jgi:hypothetical protein